MWNNYSTDKEGDIVRNEKGEIVSSNTYTADGRLRRKYSKDKAGNEHYKEYDKQGKLCGTRDINKDGSERGWSKTGDYSTQWHHNADGSGSSTNFYKGSKCGGSETDKDGNETSWGV